MAGLSFPGCSPESLHGAAEKDKEKMHKNGSYSAKNVRIPAKNWPQRFQYEKGWRADSKNPERERPNLHWSQSPVGTFCLKFVPLGAVWKQQYHYQMFRHEVVCCNNQTSRMPPPYSLYRCGALKMNDVSLMINQEHIPLFDSQNGNLQFDNLSSGLLWIFLLYIYTLSGWKAPQVLQWYPLNSNRLISKPFPFGAKFQSHFLSLQWKKRYCLSKMNLAE